MSAIEPLTAEPPPGSTVERKMVLDYVRDSWRMTLGEAECEEARWRRPIVALLKHDQAGRRALESDRVVEEDRLADCQRRL